ncbi:hypothetical protein [Acinetobacter nosocomialis]|uniref:hypothetical protein n=3 Tax=Acinetobacter nosocomialis TaxID=106654 RepID=UPI001FD6FE54|nr:hypothetical protein [Acinetobacter nosocomialis]
MASEIITRQELVDAKADAGSLEKFISGTEFEDVLTRLGMQYPTLAKAVLLIHQLGESKIDDVLNDLKIRYLALSVRGNWASNTLYNLKDLVFVDNITYICLSAHTSSTNFQNDLAAGKWAVYQGATQVDLQEYVQLKNDFPPILGERSIQFNLGYSKGFIRYGLNDATPLDDFVKHHFRGLVSPDAWGDVRNIGAGSVSFGRNGASYAYLTTTVGHDCVTYGAASMAGGAGSCTGNPDQPNEDATYGYCAFAYGKNTKAQGRISNAMGEECESNSRYSSTDGYQCIAGPQTVVLEGDVASEGAAARAHGYDSQAYGNFSFSYGALLRAHNGAQLIGKGNYSTGTPLTLRKPGLGLGFHVAKPTIFCSQGNGIDADGASVGFNTETPTNRYDFRFRKSDVMALNIDSVEEDAQMALIVRGLKNNLTEHMELFKIGVTHPNSGSPAGVTTLYQNGNQFAQITNIGNVAFNSWVDAKNGFYVNGTKVIGGQGNAIPNATSDTNSLQTTINAILGVLRAHGLIAT